MRCEPRSLWLRIESESTASQPTRCKKGFPMASAVYRPLKAPMATAAWKLVMHQGLPIAKVAGQLKTTPERVEYMLLAFEGRRAERPAA